MVGIVAIVSGIWLDGHKRRIKSEERIAMISRGVPLAEIEKMLGAGNEEKPPVKDPLRSLEQCAANRDCSGVRRGRADALLYLL